LPHDCVQLIHAYVARNPASPVRGKPRHLSQAMHSPSWISGWNSVSSARST
jgi:hypothetical protein